MTGIGESDKSLLECILLLDDDQDDRELFYDAVKSVHADTKVILLKNWEELFEKSFLQHGTPQVIFLDLNMPRKNGNECLRMIRKDPQLNNIPVIIYSTTINPADVGDTFENGAVFFLRKFTSYDTMVNMFDKLIKGKITLAKPADQQKFILNNLPWGQK
jgi:CheY-like chemotaxis protein